MKKADHKSKTLSSNAFPVVGIGASAGGLDAFKKLLKAIPENSGMAYVLVQHLDPHHESLLPELLQRVTSVPVVEISDDIKVEPDHIYIIPSNKMLLANDGVLQLSPRTAKKNERNLPIDLFFKSLAEIHQDQAIGVVLSGTASDGTQGLKAIKDSGGVTFAQDEASAAYDGMPHSAVMAGVVDYILPPEKIPQKILEIKQQIRDTPANSQNITQADEEVFKEILALLRTSKGTDFTHYKQTTIRRRILRRMGLNKNAKPSAYLKHLRENRGELNALYQDLLIPVTSFFRDPEIFAHLTKTVFPLITKNKPAGESIRIWIAGCSTGEEVYSVAICLREFLANNSSSGPDQKVQIFATDISEPAIAKARAGVYAKNEVEGLSPKQLQTFFTKTDDRFQVRKQIRDICVFAVHNFLHETPFGKMDFVSCRNVLIYMEPYLQKKALTAFHYALNPTGFLLLGKSETISSVPDLFTSADKQEKFFVPKGSSGKFIRVQTQPIEQNPHDRNTGPKNGSIHAPFQKTADEIILSKYTPAGVVVNEAMDIVHFRGKTGDYLEQASGKPSHNLFKMAKDGLAFELRNILHKCKKEKTTVLKENIQTQINGIPRVIGIEAFPLPNSIEPYYLILFHDHPSVPNTKGLKSKTSRSKKDEKDLLIQQLVKELEQDREDMRIITEDQEASNEELQSSNEELLSSSEELQSLNEELETGKEELQSTVEELTVLNQEVISLNEQLTKSRDYAEAIITTIRGPLLVLDSKLHVKTANRAFYKTFQVNELETLGVSVYALGNKQWDIPALRMLLEEIIPQETRFTDFEVRYNFPTIGERVMLLNAREMAREKGEEKLILLSIEDSTERIQHQLKEKELLSRFQNLVMQAPVAICILKGKDYRIELANEFYLQIFGVGKDFINKPIFDLLPELKTQGIKDLLDNVVASKIPFFGNELEIQMFKREKQQQSFFDFVYHPLLDPDGAVTGIILAATDVTIQVIARKRMEAQATMVQNLFMTAPGFVCTLTGPDHIYELVNDRYQQLFGKRKIQGKPILQALPELEGQGFDTLLDKVYNTGEPYVGFDIPITLARDENLAPEERYFNFSYQPMYDEHEKIYSILVFGYEVTELVNAKNKYQEGQQLHAKELEEKVQQRTLDLSEANAELQQKNEELRRMNKELESFTYVSSHDLQEPLRKIQTFASLILEKENAVLSDKGKDHFHRMLDAADRMQILIKDLLTYSHTKILDRKFEKTDLNKLVQEVLIELGETIQRKAAILKVDSLCEANINPSQFLQMMHNLIGNALKFAKPGIPPHIIIKSKIAEGSQFKNLSLSPKTKYCHLSVSDNGIGFDPQYKEQIFEVFQRLHGKNEYPGTGIGLAIVRKIVENHNGLITASGELNRGATFDIYIPAF
ncbi:MAG: chemotaxis protein CheB [Bacteroidota bacterium]|nr:chemotaxis protein CheB [Bacteroidota bacterium]